MNGVLIVGLVTGGVIAVVAVAAVVAVLVRKRRAARDEAEGELSRLGTAAGSALVRTDERARLAQDELAFAVAELGERDTADVRPLLGRARERLGEAFHLHQLLHDEVPDTPAQRREWFGRIVELCRSADGFLDDLDKGLGARRDTVRTTPDVVRRVQGEIERVRARIPDARADLDRLRAVYAERALLPVADNPDQAARLLEFASRSTAAAGRRLDAQQAREAGAAARAAEESVHRAEGLLTAVDDFEAEALRAESALGAMIAESRTELAQARALPAAQRSGRVDGAVAALEDALAALPAPGEPADPVASLSRVREANTALDDAVDDQVRRSERTRRMSAQLVPALDDAERQVASARGVIDDYRAPVGPDARTRLAEAERELAQARTADDPERAVSAARRAASLAAEAATLAHRDIARGGQGQRWDGGWNDGRHGAPAGRGDYGRPGRGGSGSDVFGAVLGGMVLGGILDDLGDIGDLFD
ncbi:hypothetical protein LEP48_09855 [Isoptericola sp. NEAU-Y5]|uniref:TPM domain-containing protein n=1 Tax=Isoptericola luteus TaxID=2879484 RepID=A0ABS7ZF37_9MICO|nr:hypothetical protein [Isoptericola sp. NEAU-Y5]MCA5893651.1 hypothetical protein [Isoptericola sp. NEAU-Y5]